MYLLLHRKFPVGYLLDFFQKSGIAKFSCIKFKWNLEFASKVSVNRHANKFLFKIKIFIFVKITLHTTHIHKF